MKYTVTIECDDDDDFKIITSAKSNYYLLEGLYDECFRPKIKYGDEVESEAFEKVWPVVFNYIDSEK